MAAHQQDLVDFLTADERQAAAGNLTSPLKAATDAIRDLRTELRHAVEHRGLTPRSHERFCQVYAPLLNAVAAGPPAHRSREWRALFAAGVLQLGAGPGGSLRLDSERAEFAITGAVQSSPPVHCDVLVGASVDPFLPERDTAPLTRSLLAGGHARPFANGWFHPGGFDIDQVGRLVRADGTITPNFCALGHPTEGAHYFTNMLPAPGVDSRVTADAEAAVRAMAEHLRHTVAHRANPPSRPRSRTVTVAPQRLRWIDPFTVTGRHVSLIPLEFEHEQGLVEAVQDGRVWDTWFAAVPSPTACARRSSAASTWPPPAPWCRSPCSTPRAGSPA